MEELSYEMASRGRILLNKMEWFNYMRPFQVDQCTQMTHWSLLHANQACVPEGTPVPGFEHLMQCYPRSRDQKIHAAKRPDLPKSFLDDLYGLGGDEVEALFNGISDSPVFNDDPERYKDIDQLPDPTVLYNLLDETSNAPRPPSMLAFATKSEPPQSPVCGDSVYGSSVSSPGPRSPSVSEAGSNTSSTDEGIQSDISDLEYIGELLESMNSSAGSPSLPTETGRHFIKQESPATPQKPAIKRRKRGPRPLVKYRGDGPIQLWQFLLELVTSPDCSKLIRWTQDEDYEFKILQPSTVAKMWGKKKNKPTMNYEKLSRGIRYYYGNSVIEKVHGKRYVYRFLCDIPKILGYDPMEKKCEEFVEDSVYGEAIMSPEVEDLLVASSVEADLLAGSLDFSVLY